MYIASNCALHRNGKLFLIEYSKYKKKKEEEGDRFESKSELKHQAWMTETQFPYNFYVHSQCCCCSVAQSCPT